MKKEQFLEHWKAIDPGQKLKPTPVPYKHRGSTYGEDGIRITGSPEFIDSVLSRLKDMLLWENGTTRLQVVHKKSEPKPGQSAALLPDSHNCYIQVHMRGREAQISAGFFDKGLMKTEQTLIEYLGG